MEMHGSHFQGAHILSQTHANPKPLTPHPPPHPPPRGCAGGEIHSRLALNSLSSMQYTPFHNLRTTTSLFFWGGGFQVSRSPSGDPGSARLMQNRLDSANVEVAGNRGHVPRKARHGWRDSFFGVFFWVVPCLGWC